MMLEKAQIELFNRYLKKDLSKDQLVQLKEILRTESGRDEFVRFMEETGVLIHNSRQQSAIAIEDAELSGLVRRSEKNLLFQLTKRQLLSEGQSKTSQDIGNKEPKKIKTLHFIYLGLLGIAAAILLFVLNPALMINSENELPLIKSVARVTAFSGKGNVLEGDWLKPGLVELIEGKIEITFDSGAVILLQGKSSLKLETVKRAYLNYGKMSAKVPEEAIGFIINTPQGTVVDLGTEFAISVDDENAMEVHVIEGEVEAGSVQGNEPKLLKKDESLRIEQNGLLVTDTKLSQASFSRVPKFSEEISYNYIYWPFDKVHSNIVRDEGNGGLGGVYDLRVPNPKMNLKSGKVGKSLSLSGKGEYAQSSFPGIGSANARTVAFWVKIPPDSNRSEAYSIVSWGKVAPSQKWQVGYNPNPDNGVVGAIRTEFSHGWVIGTTDLRDGRWHHVVSMFIGGKKPDVATHIRHYIDGKLEGVSGYRARKINTKISGPDSQPVYLGKYINHDNWYFRGKIDEFYIFDGALTPSQISLLRNDLFK